MILILIVLNPFLKIARTPLPSEEKRPIPSAQALMMDKIAFRSAKIEEFHFYGLIVEMSFATVFDAEASGCHAVILSKQVGLFRVHTYFLTGG